MFMRSIKMLYLFSLHYLLIGLRLSSFFIFFFLEKFQNNEFDLKICSITPGAYIMHINVQLNKQFEKIVSTLFEFSMNKNV